MICFSCPVKYDESKEVIYDSTLRKIIFDIANADNYDDEDFIPEYKHEKLPDFSKIRKSKNRR